MNGKGVIKMSIENGNCPNCDECSLEVWEKEFPTATHILSKATCQNCGKEVIETYKLISQEIEESD